MGDAEIQLQNAADYKRTAAGRERGIQKVQYGVTTTKILLKYML